MTTILVRVLLTLAFVAIASAQICTLCPNGEKPRNRNAVLLQFGTYSLTCKELAEDIIDASDDAACEIDTYHAFQVVCGCPMVKAGSCPGICNTGSILAQPGLGTQYDGITCSVVDQYLRKIPGDTSCDTGLANIGIEKFCTCKVKGAHGQNMDGGMGMMGMPGGRQLRLRGLEEHFPPRATRGLAM